MLCASDMDGLCLTFQPRVCVAHYSQCRTLFSVQLVAYCTEMWTFLRSGHAQSRIPCHSVEFDSLSRIESSQSENSNFLKHHSAGRIEQFPAANMRGKVKNTRKQLIGWRHDEEALLLFSSFYFRAVCFSKHMCFCNFE